MYAFEVIFNNMALSMEQSYFPQILDGREITKRDELKFEALRLKTFQNWQAYQNASPLTLAKAGFSYTQIDDIVKCHVCNIQKGGWNRHMNPLIVHKELSPRCGFCLGQDGVNVPMFVPEEPSYKEILDRLHRQYCPAGEPSTRARGLGERPDAASRHGLMTPQPHFPVVAADSGSTDTSILVIGSGGPSQPTPVREDFAPMKHEANRFASFDANWPGDGTPDPRDLARAGFYFTGSVDRVQCVFCRGILRNWDEDDVPMEEHRRHFPMCPFVLGLEVGNVPDPAAVVSANRTSEFINVFQPVVNDATLGIVTERPKHSQYAVEASRMSSFRNWPRGKEQTPQALAKAGFFYVGFGDSVKCFYCDGGLRTWERGDDPWTEHARWFPRCPFVRQVKGEEFIKTAQRNNQQAVVSSAGETSRVSAQEEIPVTKEEEEDDDADDNDVELLEENRQLKEQRLCKICMDEEVSVVFLPCGHLVCCSSCAPALRKCPVCRAKINGSVRTFMS